MTARHIIESLLAEGARTGYHGTDALFSTFHGHLPAFFASDPEDAASYAEDAAGEGRYVVRSDLSRYKLAEQADIMAACAALGLQDADALIQNNEDTFDLIDELRWRGFEGTEHWDQNAITGDPFMAYCIFDPEGLRAEPVVKP